MKVQLVKGETKETFGEGDNSFDYWHRPLTVEEKQNVNAHVPWKTVKGHGEIDFSRLDPFELVRLTVTKIDNLYDEHGAKVDTIEKLLSLPADAGTLDGVVLAMWIKIWTAANLPEELKKKLSQDSTPVGKDGPTPDPAG